MKKHLNNIALLILNTGVLYLSLLILEYEISKIRTPETIWIPTPTNLDLTLSGFLVFLGILNISVLVLIYLKETENRKWLWGTTAVGLLIFAVLALVLKNKLPCILFPGICPGMLMPL